MKITEKTFDITTGQETITQRNQTETELAERKALTTKQAEYEALKKQAETARAALLDKLGITADEAKLLLS